MEYDFADGGTAVKVAFPFTSVAVPHTLAHVPKVTRSPSGIDPNLDVTAQEGVQDVLQEQTRLIRARLASAHSRMR